MTSTQVIAAMQKEDGTLAENLAALLQAIGNIETVATYNPPRCACGATLSVWPGARTGYVFIRHPHNWGCPRDAYRAWGPTAEVAMRTYVAKAPDLGALDMPPPDALDEFEF